MQEVHDPVCGRSFPWDEARGICRHRGWLYYFCGDRCRTRFSNNPAAYLKRPPSSNETPISGIPPERG